LPPAAEYGWWYQYYFATERGRLGYSQYRHDFDKLIWKNVSPKWNFDDATFDRTAASFDNPDHVDIVIHNYRRRLGLAKGEPQYDELEQKLFKRPVITVPAITISSDFDELTVGSGGRAEGAGAVLGGAPIRSTLPARRGERAAQGVGVEVGRVDGRGGLLPPGLV